MAEEFVPRFAKDEIEYIEARWLKQNPRNWRRHPERQKSVVRAALREIGTVDPLKVVPDPEGSGKYLIMDGNLRANLFAELSDDTLVPVLILDLDEEEMDKALLTYDSSTMLYEADPDMLPALLKSVALGPEYQSLISELNNEVSLMSQLSNPDDDDGDSPTPGDPGGPVDVYLQTMPITLPAEHVAKARGLISQVLTEADITFEIGTVS